MEGRTVCVTGARGFVASWLVNLLLSRGYKVHATVRDPEYNMETSMDEELDALASRTWEVVPHSPDDKKNAHLLKLDNASERLQLFKADLLDYDSLLQAIVGCEGVFHTACPVPSQKVSIPKNWYYYSKTLSEEIALDYGNQLGNSVVIGPLLQATVNASSLILLNLVKVYESMDNRLMDFVDVRDVVEALLLTYEKPTASGRYICSFHPVIMRDVVEKLKGIYPQYKYPANFPDVPQTPSYTCSKLKSLGWIHRELEETFVDSIRCFQESGLLHS